MEKHEQADELFSNLLYKGVESLVMHGKHDFVDRDNTLQDFKKGLKQVLIATSLLARGIDVVNCVLVVNYFCPNHQEDYIHRIGRTGRAGMQGTAITFIDPETEGKFGYEVIKVLEGSE